MECISAATRPVNPRTSNASRSGELYARRLRPKVHSAQTGAGQLRRAPAGLQRDPAGGVPAHGGRLWELCHPEVL